MWKCWQLFFIFAKNLTISGYLIGEVVVIWYVLRAVYVLFKYLVDLLK